MKKKKIYFDMDGTIADLYGQENWLTHLKSESAHPYENAKPMLNMQALARVLNRLNREGWEIGIVSWLAKGSTSEYSQKVIQAKKEWLAKHLKSVNFRNIDIIPYGEPKEKDREGILFDDEKPNRDNWQGKAYKPQEIMQVLKAL